MLQEGCTDYRIQVTVFDYSNPSGHCITCHDTSAEPPGCCDNYTNKYLACNGEDICDNGLFYCLRRLGLNSGLEPEMSGLYLRGNGGNSSFNYVSDLCLSGSNIRAGPVSPNSTHVNFALLNTYSGLVGPTTQYLV